MDTLTTSEDENKCFELLKELVHYLVQHHGKKTADKGNNIKTLSDIKIALYPWSQNYFGDLTQPNFKNILEAFIEINIQHTHQIGTLEDYMAALEFLYSREIKGLQSRYGMADWSKTLTKTEHAVMLQNKPPLANADSIHRFIKILLKSTAQGKEKKNLKKKWEHEMEEDEVAEPDLENILPGKENEILKRVIKRALPPPPIITPSESKKARVQIEKPLQSKEKVKRKTRRQEEEDSDELSGNNTRQRQKAAYDLLSSHFPILFKIIGKNAQEDEVDKQKVIAVYWQIKGKEKAMLENMKYLNRKYKRFLKPVQLWDKGFSNLYIFWINLIVSHALTANSKGHNPSEMVIGDFYMQDDDVTFLKIVGQQQADILHRKEYHRNHDDPSSYIVSHSMSLDENDESIFRENTEIGDSEHKHKNKNLSFDLWKGYITLLLSEDEDIKWRYNYNFISIHLFLALMRNNLIRIDGGTTIEKECYTMLNTAYDIHHASKMASPPPQIASSEKEREDRYACICNEIIVQAGKTTVKTPTSWLDTIVQWEPYWNLVMSLPSSHPLLKIISSPSQSKTRIKAGDDIISPSRATPKFEDRDLDLKTHERLRKWWFQKPFFFNHTPL